MTKYWSTAPRQGSKLHQVCSYQGSFLPAIPRYFLDRYHAETVLDPFCGRGTVVLEAALQDSYVYGCDVSPLAVLLSSVKLQCDPLAKVLKEIETLDLHREVAPSPPADVAPFYHPETWQELWNLRQARRSRTLTALALGKLHGHSPGFFSGVTLNVISVHGRSLQKAQAKHGTQPEPRDVKKLLAKAARKFIPAEGVNGSGRIFCADSRATGLPDESVDLVITSPPFLDVIDYADVNWLRLWFLGERCPGTSFRRVPDYEAFLKKTLFELRRVIRKSGHIVFEVGPVKREHNLSQMVVVAAQAVNLKVEDVVKHSFEDDDVSKISRAMTGGKKTTTMQNHCVVLVRG